MRSSVRQGQEIQETKAMCKHWMGMGENGFLIPRDKERYSEQSWNNIYFSFSYSLNLISLLFTTPFLYFALCCLP